MNRHHQYKRTTKSHVLDLVNAGWEIREIYLLTSPRNVNPDITATWPLRIYFRREKEFLEMPIYLYDSNINKIHRLLNHLHIDSTKSHLRWVVSENGKFILQ
jgi:hypothetical protein